MILKKMHRYNEFKKNRITNILTNSLNLFLLDKLILKNHNIYINIIIMYILYIYYSYKYFRLILGLY